eukprot:3232714-Rhodomonas_salina.2
MGSSLRIIISSLPLTPARLIVPVTVTVDQRLVLATTSYPGTLGDNWAQQRPQAVTIRDLEGNQTRG